MTMTVTMTMTMTMTMTIINKGYRSLNFFQASFSAISLIAVYLRGSIRYLSPAGLI